MLTLQTQIPTSSRGAVRALVKAHPDWQAFITAKGKLSAQALNAELLEFALLHPALTARIEAVLAVPALGGATSQTLGDMMVEAGAMTQDERDSIDDNLDAPAIPAGATAFELDTLLGPVEPFLSPLVKG